MFENHMNPEDRSENSISENIRSFYDGHWEWFIRTDPPPYEITGKYLFFSPYRNLLEDIAVEELEHDGFHHAKIPMIGKNLTSEYVLCLYYEDDSRKQELAIKYRNREGIKYRYWKSDEATLRSEYSEEFQHTVHTKMSQTISMYVQYPDFSIDEKGSVDLDSAMRALNNFSWDISTSPNYDPEDFAHPTIGFQDSSGSLIEICRLEEGFHIRLDYIVKNKTSRLRLSNSREMKFGTVCDIKSIERLLGHFFKSEFEIIESQI